MKGLSCGSCTCLGAHLVLGGIFIHPTHIFAAESSCEELAARDLDLSVALDAVGILLAERGDVVEAHGWIDFFNNPLLLPTFEFATEPVVQMNGRAASGGCNSLKQPLQIHDWCL